MTYNGAPSNGVPFNGRAFNGAPTNGAPANGRAPDLPQGAEAREAGLMRRLSPSARAWLQDEGRRQAALGDPSEASARQAVLNRFPDLGGADGDIEALCFVVMMEAAKSAQEDLQSVMDGVKAINQAKAKQREVLAVAQERQAKLAQDAAFSPPCPPGRVCGLALSKAVERDTPADLGDEQSLRIRSYEKRYSKFTTTLSNILRKVSDTDSSIIRNLK